MMKGYILVFSFCLASFHAFTQIDSTFVDTHYLEDQMYIGVTYNIITEAPDAFKRNGLSGGISLGIIKDMPLNERRNVSVGVGLGYSYNAFVQNLKISKIGNVSQFEIIANEDFDKNRLATHTIEMPLEFRWRTSTPSRYKFWRIYGGVKLGYVFANNSKFSDSSESILLKNIEEVKDFQYGATLSVGYNTLNLHVYYGLSELFKDANIESQSIQMKQLNIGLMFYIL